MCAVADCGIARAGNCGNDVAGEFRLSSFWRNAGERHYGRGVLSTHGSFDPITLGHCNVIERGCKLVDEFIVGVGLNIDKPAMFTAEERVDLILRATSHLDNVIVKMFNGLAVRFVRDCEAHVIIRGVRSLTDMEMEFTMTLANRKLDPGIETGLPDG